jgi:aromatic-L-amino-acid/L-tryptophan decarboxylase
VPESDLGDIGADEFREHGHAAVEWIARYLEGIEARPVLSRATPGQVRAGIPDAPPEEAESLTDILADIDRVVMDGITHWNHPGFMAYFAISGSGPGILGEMLTAAFNANGMLWKTSPAVTELEEATLDWLRQMLGLDAGLRGILMDTASMATFSAMVAARERATGGETRRRGMDGHRLRAYTSEEAHSSVIKAAISCGIGEEGIRRIRADGAFCMDADALSAAIEEDIAAGWTPLFVVATVGTTSTTSVDPVGEIVAACRPHGIWTHVDAAYAGMAAIADEYRWALEGCESVDSLVVNPHKWLFTPIDCSAFYVRDPAALQEAFSLVPEYLRTEDRDVTDYMDWGLQLGRRFRALKLWMVIRRFGRAGLAARIREHIRLAHVFAARVESDDRFELMAPAPFSTICFRYRPHGMSDEPALRDLNAAILDAVNATGTVYLSHTALRGAYVLRLAVGNLRTTKRHIEQAWVAVTESLGHLPIH